MQFVGQIFWLQKDRKTFFVVVCKQEEKFVWVSGVPYSLKRISELGKVKVPDLENIQEYMKDREAKGVIKWSEDGPHLELAGEKYSRYTRWF
ncbi:hypothetical protein C8_468 [Cannes 8 virus]|uniref:Uncharacterized protein n=1 Tax=Marseillevirus marseillevirus TaxID=694581 RepID=D2XB77_GBMV|nr:hypothetical protein MAR_ORF442 [Marseillevirus marseillevirus]ADB04204.1 hypothetical protein MAR_ORF442 [Marseillevirus marseillevirus]AGV01817.1 hypothetical protein C8_468 [Cannes 8 virus]ANB78283.1 hypothetical protein MEL_392b [Melbournevirus]AVR53165.1 hypothetical protein MarSH_460 [Marseillevirus Shanghai 1]